MRGVVLAGGTGSRLGSLTKAVNKHLLQVYDRPMVSWALAVLRANGITDITVVSSPQGVGQLAALLGEGYSFRVQSKPGGIAHALLEAETKSDELIAVVLGDNVFLPPPKLPKHIPGIGHVYLARVLDPRPYGVAEFTDNEISGVIEKPAVPPSDFVTTGLYVFESTIFTWLKTKQAGEYSFTEVLATLATNGRLSYELLVDTFWGDAGTLEGLEACSAACKEFKR